MIGPLAQSLVAAADPYAAARAAMTAKIATDVRAAASAADTPAFRRALAVVARLPREAFVAPAGRPAAYVALPQAIGYGQTISDPYIVTVMTAALDLGAGARVLDIGTGSGYQAAVLAPLAAEVWSVEIVAPLARRAAHRLAAMGYRNVHVRHGDGFAGWAGHAPFDGIIVAAGASAVPQPLIDQLKPGGHLVMPIGPSTAQELLLRFTRQADGRVTRCSLGGAMFVPLTGQGARPDAMRGLIDRGIPSCYGAPIT
jgi:protein-L-isoaspartate(D-aspartate) O-methyltransferase